MSVLRPENDPGDGPDSGGRQDKNLQGLPFGNEKKGEVKCPR
jgi:hypothetical protein